MACSEASRQADALPEHLEALQAGVTRRPALPPNQKQRIFLGFAPGVKAAGSYMCLMIASPNSEHLTSVAFSIRRAKS